MCKAYNDAEWVIEVYGGDPSSPFSEREIAFFAQKVLLQDPNNSVACNILNPKKHLIVYIVFCPHFIRSAFFYDTYYREYVTDKFTADFKFATGLF